MGNAEFEFVRGRKSSYANTNDQTLDSSCKETEENSQESSRSSRSGAEDHRPSYIYDPTYGVLPREVCDSWYRKEDNFPISSGQTVSSRPLPPVRGSRPPSWGSSGKP
jgi:hypothetical protein